MPCFLFIYQIAIAPLHFYCQYPSWVCGQFFTRKISVFKPTFGLSILIYYGVHSLRSQLKRQGSHESLRTLRKRVGHRLHLTTVYLNQQGQWVGLRRDVMPNVDEQLLYTKLGLPLSLHRRKNNTI